jgi:cob(I)alamin adenosyltransferase
VLGLARSAGLGVELDTLLQRIQNELFALGAQLATPDPVAHGTNLVTATQIEGLEKEIDAREEGLPALTQFILPCGTAGAAYLHLARTVCRRAERRVVSLARDAEAGVSLDAVVYLNRLSDLLFVLARCANRAAGVGETPWQKPVA